MDKVPGIFLTIHLTYNALPNATLLRIITVLEQPKSGGTGLAIC